MIITFIGHRSIIINDIISNKIKNAITEVISNETSVKFYCGGYGKFDEICASICRKIKANNKNCEIILITPYFTISQQTKIKALLCEKLYDAVIYPPIENYSPRFAITKRNEWMIKNSDIIIAYVSHDYGGAYKSLKYAQKQNKIIMNLST